MDNTIHIHSSVTKDLLSHSEEKENSIVSEANSSKPDNSFSNKNIVGSNVLSSDVLNKCERVHNSDSGDVLNVKLEEDCQNLDTMASNDMNSAGEDNLQDSRENLGKEINEDSGIPDETSSKAPTEFSSESKSNENVTSEKQEEEEWMDILGSGQLKKKVLRPGTSSFRPSRSWLCQVTYEARLPDGNVVEKCEDLNLQIGDGEVIEGLDLVLPLMDVGELALVEVAPRFAYDSQGLEPNIPPNTTLMYAVELLSAQPEPELETIPAAKRRKIGNSKRNHGNKWYERQKYTMAIQCYRRALEYLDEIVDENGIAQTQEKDEEVHSLLEDRLKVYNNMAAAQMKIEAYDAALTSVGHVLLCQPDNVKALYRKGKILRGMGNNSEARAVLAKANLLDPNSKIIHKEFQVVSQICKEEARKEKDLYKKMFTKETSAEESKNNKSQVPWGAIIGSVSAAAVAIIATLTAYKYKFI